MKNAARAGISINDFWDMTPRELNIYFDAYVSRIKQEQDNMMTYTYIGAWLQRVKNMPPLKKFISTKEPPKKQTPDEMLEEIKKINASLGGNTY